MASRFCRQVISSVRSRRVGPPLGDGAARDLVDQLHDLPLECPVRRTMQGVATHITWPRRSVEYRCHPRSAARKGSREPDHEVDSDLVPIRGRSTVGIPTAIQVRRQGLPSILPPMNLALPIMSNPASTVDVSIRSRSNTVGRADQTCGRSYRHHAVQHRRLCRDLEGRGTGAHAPQRAFGARPHRCRAGASRRASRRKRAKNPDGESESGVAKP